MGTPRSAVRLARLRRGRAASDCDRSENGEVLLHLPVGELNAVLVPFLPLQLDVAVEDVRAEGLLRQLGARELVDRLAERLGEGDDPALTPLLRREVVEARLHRLGQLVGPPDSPEAPQQPAGEGEGRGGGPGRAAPLGAAGPAPARLVTRGPGSAP